MKFYTQCWSWHYIIFYFLLSEQWLDFPSQKCWVYLPVRVSGGSTTASASHQMVYLPMHWVLSTMLSACGCGNVVTSILVVSFLCLILYLLEISWKMLHIAFHVCIIVGIMPSEMLSVMHSYNISPLVLSAQLPLLLLSCRCCMTYKYLDLHAWI